MLFMSVCASAAPRGAPSVAQWRAAWLDLIKNEKITSVATLGTQRVRYGLRLSEADRAIEEFCVDEANGASLGLSASHAVMEPYQITLRANRALRPPAAPKLGELPPHDEASCSMCTGPLRLEIRPMVAQTLVPQSGRCWDVHFNISPMEPDGHFLLVPEITRAENRRQQRLTRADCDDLVLLGRACEARLCVNFNAALAGASQNHIHAHAWAIPTPYAVCNAPVLTSIALPGGVEADELHWPASVVRLRGADASAVGAAVDCLCNLEAVHNVAVIGDDVYVFVRAPSGEVSPRIPDLKLGTIQLLGHIVVDSAAQFEAAMAPGAIDAALRDTRAETPVSELLQRVASNLC